jgi:hypothetical protein
LWGDGRGQQRQRDKADDFRSDRRTDARFTAVQDYTYDSLNRLKSAVENITPTGGSQSMSWQQTFEFDRYGNRNFDEANTTFTGFDKLCESGNAPIDL